MKPIRLVHLITDLNTGGAEITLYRLLSGMDRSRFDNLVVSLIPAGPTGVKIRALGIPVYSLGMHPGHLSIVALFKLVKLLKEYQTDIVQTWLYHADLLGGLATKLSGDFPLVWGIHNTTLDIQKSKWSTHAVVWILAKLSARFPARIVSCSTAAQNVHIKLGYHTNKFLTINNGFDLDIFHPISKTPADIRSELMIPPAIFLIGMIARYDPQKDHSNFIAAAKVTSTYKKDVHFLLCGDGIDWKNKELADQIRSCGLQNSFHLLGHREDIPLILAGMDAHTLSSAYGEAFPLVLGEAMACGIPCVATDVGDAAFIIGNTGYIVPPQNAIALAEAWMKLIDLGAEARHQLGQEARGRIQNNFSIDKMITAYEELYKSLMQHNPKN